MKESLVGHARNICRKICWGLYEEGKSGGMKGCKWWWEEKNGAFEEWLQCNADKKCGN